MLFCMILEYSIQQYYDTHVPYCAGSGNMLSAESQVAITAVICSLVFLIMGMLLGVLCHYLTITRCTTFKSKHLTSNNPLPPTEPPPVVYEEMSPETHSQVKSDIELEENVAYGSV